MKCRRSLPSRERGLKFVEARFKVTVDFVAPLAGAWIEILKRQNVSTKRLVAPFAGAWIEITLRFRPLKVGTSLPSRERGLK